MTISLIAHILASHDEQQMEGGELSDYLVLFIRE